MGLTWSNDDDNNKQSCRIMCRCLSRELHADTRQPFCCAISCWSAILCPSVRPSVRFLADPAPCSCRKRTVAAYTLYTLLTDTLLLLHLHLKKERTKKEDPLNPDGTHDFLIIPLTGLFSLEPSPSPHETQQQQSETRSRERKKDLNPIPNAWGDPLTGVRWVRRQRRRRKTTSAQTCMSFLVLWRVSSSSSCVFLFSLREREITYAVLTLKLFFFFFFVLSWDVTDLVDGSSKMRWIQSIRFTVLKKRN